LPYKELTPQADAGVLPVGWVGWAVVNAAMGRGKTEEAV
jgi:hypothetical protein